MAEQSVCVAGNFSSRLYRAVAADV